ncbi:hypothetical protein [Pseudonocardia humida]|uniref:Small secreted domain DUF320 n=1 Tax=Pseudonocardia humida TaxID=2800819 RepID=A0ABT1ADQ0_9PSEU|nr:hypothetical protein [Pseudonocardia humida]MCO1661195.1 hypothetical protein [Pseudonocardia humida]
MLKKTGIIIATATAGLLAVGGLAFATTPHHDEPTRAGYTNVEQGNVGNDCQFAQTGPAIDSVLSGGDALIGAGGAAANVVAPISAPVQALNCTNVSVTDVIDDNSNNETTTATETEVEDSNNTVTAPAPGE